MIALFGRASWLAAHAARVASGACAAENSPHGRGPPLRAAMGGRRLARVEAASDLADALAFRMPRLNVTHEFVRDGGRSSRRRLARAPSGRPSPLFDEPLELVDWDKPRSPGHLDGLEQRQHPPVEGGAAHPERLGRLRPRAGEALDIRRLTNDDRPGTRGRIPSRLLGLASLPGAGHPYRCTRTTTRICMMMHLCLACYRGE
jgi:hypothetical protein